MTGQEPKEVVLTPEQRRRLGQEYRLVISWRRKRINKAEKPSHHESTEGSSQSERINSNPVGSIESEA